MTIETEESLIEKRLAVGREEFNGCQELPTLINKDQLINQAADNGVSDIVDMTEGTLLRDQKDIKQELNSVNFV